MGAVKVCAVVASPDNEPLGLGVAPVPGWPDRFPSAHELGVAVAKAVAEADRMAAHHSRRVWAALSGPAVKCRVAEGVVQITSTDLRVGRADLERVMASVAPPNSDLLHRLLVSTTLDGEEILEDPLGLTGRRLEARIVLVEAAGKRREELHRALAAIGLQAAGFIAGILASASALTPAEREVGAAIVDLGATHTSVTVYLRGSPRHMAIINLGGLHATRDLSVALGMPIVKAEELKLEGAWSKAKEQDLAAQVIFARVGETLELVRSELIRTGWAGRLPGGFVLTGGGAMLAELKTLAGTVLGAPVRIGLPQVGTAQELVAGSAYAVVIGLAAAVRHHTRAGESGSMTKGVGWWKSWYPRRRLPV